MLSPNHKLLNPDQLFLHIALVTWPGWSVVGTCGNNVAIHFFGVGNRSHSSLHW